MLIRGRQRPYLVSMAQIVQELTVPLPHPALPTGDWADAYRVITKTHFPNARAAGEAAFGRFPFWVNALMVLRNMLVAPFGLKTDEKNLPTHDHIGFFPVLTESETQSIVGMNDKHLDFRCVIDLNETDEGQAVTIATIIRRHNRLGRAYLTIIMPFHRLILRTVLARVARGRSV